MIRSDDYEMFVTPIRVIDLDQKEQDQIRQHYANVWDEMEYNAEAKVKTTWGYPQQPVDMCPLLQDIIVSNLEGFIERITNMTSVVTLKDHWLQEYNHGGSHAPHHHPKSIVSGVYYIESNNLGSPLVFYNPNSAQHFMNYATYSSQVECWQGRLVLFPSWVLHGVPECRDEETVRRATAFNIVEDHNG